MATADIHSPKLASTHADVLLREEAISDPSSHEVIAAIAAANGNFSSAAVSEKTAIQKAKQFRWNTTLMNERLTRYQNQSAWTGDLFALPARRPLK